MPSLFFNNKKTVDAFPPLANFFYYCQKTDPLRQGEQRGGEHIRMVWNTVICRRNLSEQVTEMLRKTNLIGLFKFKEAERIKEVWGMSDKDVDAIRYFVCQTRHKNQPITEQIHLPVKRGRRRSRQGKTTIRNGQVVNHPNGDSFDSFGTYESTLSTEMQYNDHDIPAGALYNAVILDEAMPKDSSKSYGLIKQVLTSNSCKYNQKFGFNKKDPLQAVLFLHINEDVIDFVQDMDERRFYAIRMVKKPRQLSFDDIYQTWLDPSHQRRAGRRMAEVVRFIQLC